MPASGRLRLRRPLPRWSRPLRRHPRRGATRPYNFHSPRPTTRSDGKPYNGPFFAIPEDWPAQVPPAPASTPLIPAFIAAVGCGNTSSSSSPTVIRLVDAFKPEMVEGSAAHAPTEWRFTAGTAGWIAGRNVEGLGLREGRLTGRSATDYPILSVARTRDLGNADQLHAVEIRMRVSAGSNVAFSARPAFGASREGANSMWLRK